MRASMPLGANLFNRLLSAGFKTLYAFPRLESYPADYRFKIENRRAGAGLEMIGDLRIRRRRANLLQSDE